MKTHTPELDSTVLERLRDYAALFAQDFPQAKPARWAGVYLQGLLLDGHCPLDLRLYLPDSWLSDPERLDQAGVPAAERRPLTKPQIALELLDRVRGEGLPGWAVVTDAGYGASADFRDGVAARGLVYLAGVTRDFVVFTQPPTWVAPGPSSGGRPATRHHLAADNPPPVALSDLAQRVR